MQSEGTSCVKRGNELQSSGMCTCGINRGNELQSENKLCQSRKRITGQRECIPNPRKKMSQFVIPIYLCLFENSFVPSGRCIYPHTPLSIGNSIYFDLSLFWVSYSPDKTKLRMKLNIKRFGIIKLKI